jgi:hypothetical protein
MAGMGMGRVVGCDYSHRPCLQIHVDIGCPPSTLDTLTTEPPQGRSEVMLSSVLVGRTGREKDPLPFK